MCNVLRTTMTKVVHYCILDFKIKKKYFMRLLRHEFDSKKMDMKLMIIPSSNLKKCKLVLK